MLMKMSARFIGYIYIYAITTTTTSSNRGKRRLDFASEASEDLRSKRQGAKEQESPISKSSLEKLKETWGESQK